MIQGNIILIKEDHQVFLGDKINHLKKLRRFAIHRFFPLQITHVTFNQMEESLQLGLL